VEKATQRQLGRLPKHLAESAEAAAAMALAQGLDGGNSLTSKSMAAKAHSEILAVLRALAPPEQSEDGLDDLGARRRARLAGKPASARKRSS